MNPLTTRQADMFDICKKAARYARSRFNYHKETDCAICHDSFAADKALDDTQAKFPELGGYGVQGDCAGNGENHITIQYINRGDTYDMTVCYYKGRFVASSWGDIVERVQ